MGYMMFQNPHIVPATVGGDALIRIGRAGGIKSGTFWEVATKTNGNFNIGKEASTTIGICINPSGNVGIGKQTPAYKLDVNGSINISSGNDFYINNTSISNLYLSASAATSISNLTTTSNTIFTNLNSLSTNSILSINNLNATSTTMFNSINSLSVNGYITSVSYLNATSTTIFNNLNSLSTNSMLSINNINATSTTIFGIVNSHTTALTVLGNGPWNTTGTGIFYSGGNVGIGTIPSAFTLDVNGTANIGGLRLNGFDSMNTIFQTNRDLCIRVHAGFDILFAAGVVNIMYMTSDGNVGIGTNTPSQKLHVSGNIISSGTIASESGESTLKYLKVLNPDGRNTYLSYSGNGQNYIRGQLNVDLDNIYCGGNIGVGVIPSYRLHIAATTANTGTMNMRYFNYGSSTSGYTNFADTCAYFASSLWCASWIASSSDIRIKTNIQDIVDDTALQQILNIQPKTYEYIDKVKNGNKKVYGFIAQQIKEIIPEAIALQSEVIPNIYKNGICETNKITLDCDVSNILNINDKIDIIDDNGNYKQYTILSIENNSFTIDDNIETNNVFVYGSKVNDFHTVSKDYIFTLNVCATQELHKLIKQQNLIIQDLQNRLSILENKII
jgi:hypothetical protein